MFRAPKYFGGMSIIHRKPFRSCPETFRVWGLGFGGAVRTRFRLELGVQGCRFSFRAEGLVILRCCTAWLCIAANARWTRLVLVRRRPFVALPSSKHPPSSKPSYAGLWTATCSNKDDDKGWRGSEILSKVLYETLGLRHDGAYSQPLLLYPLCPNLLWFSIPWLRSSAVEEFIPFGFGLHWVSGVGFRTLSVALELSYPFSKAFRGWGSTTQGSSTPGLEFRMRSSY